jgi:uncharacterized membrane protein YeaQ/YmgE (transglycosylase-associated protein family)
VGHIAICQASQEGIMFNLLWEAIIGLIVGVLAKFIMPGKDPGGIFITMLIGVAGSLLATFIGSHVGLYREGQSAGFIMSVLGAILLLAIYRLIRGKTASA